MPTDRYALQRSTSVYPNVKPGPRPPAVSHTSSTYTSSVRSGNGPSVSLSLDDEFGEQRSENVCLVSGPPVWEHEIPVDVACQSNALQAMLSSGNLRPLIFKTNRL